MNKLVILFTLLLLSCASVYHTSEFARVSHFLWKVSDENSSVWILGSVHFADSSFYPLDSVIENAFANSKELAVEIDMSDDSVSEDVKRKSMEQGFFDDGRNLKGMLGDSLWQELERVCIEFGISSAVFVQMRPWLAAMTLSVVAIEKAGIRPEYGIDASFLARASEAGMPIVGMETSDEQVQAVAGDKSSDSSGISYLASTLDEISRIDTMISQMTLAWKTGNDSLLRVVLDDGHADSLMEENVYRRRNAKMAEIVSGYLKEDRTVFVVVGAAHLVLENDNVIERLKRKGFRVERF